MSSIIREIRKHLRLYVVFVRNCLAAQMEYRANFIISMLIECTYLLLKVLYAVFAYQMDIHVNGLTPDSILLFIGTYTMMTGVMNALFFTNFTRIPQYVNDGSMDMFITKPVSLQYMVTLRYVDFGLAIPNITGGAVMIVMAWNKLGIGANPVKILEVFICFGLKHSHNLCHTAPAVIDSLLDSQITINPRHYLCCVGL